MLFLVLNVFLVLFFITFFLLVSLSSVSTQSVIKKTWVVFLSAMALVEKWLQLFWPIFWALSSFFVLLLCVPYPFFLCLSVFLPVPLIRGVFPWSLGLCSHLPSVCPLPSWLTSLQHLSLWQTCAITRTLWTIARLPIKGVISPQWPMPWQGWVLHPHCQPCPVAPGPSATSMTVSSARPVKRPSKDSRSDWLILCVLTV